MRQAPCLHSGGDYDTGSLQPASLTHAPALHALLLHWQDARPSSTSHSASNHLRSGVQRLCMSASGLFMCGKSTRLRGDPTHCGGHNTAPLPRMCLDGPDINRPRVDMRPVPTRQLAPFMSLVFVPPHVLPSAASTAQSVTHTGTHTHSHETRSQHSMCAHRNHRLTCEPAHGRQGAAHTQCYTPLQVSGARVRLPVCGCHPLDASNGCMRICMRGLYAA